MFKAVKECMRNWVMTHKRLYWYIVVGIAALAFGIITGMGCAKLERAEAAEQTLKVNWKGQEVYLPVGNYPYYIVVKNGNGSGNDYVFLSYDKLVAKYNSPYACISLVDELGNVVQSGNPVRVYGYDTSKTDFMQSYSDGWSYAIGKSFPSVSNVISNYDVIRVDTGAVLYESIVGYSSDAPYLEFKQLGIDNKLNKGTIDNNVDGHLYSDYFSTSAWMYVGNIKNITASDISYTLNLEFDVELPTNEYLNRLVNEYGLNYTLDTVILRRNTELIKHWQMDDNADYRTIKVKHSVDVVPNEYTNISYTFNFAEWEYMLRASSPDLNEELLTYDASWRSALLSFMHVRKITTEVLTTRSDAIVYGGVTTNTFERGCIDDRGFCNDAVDVYINADKGEISDDVLKDMIADALRDAEQEYMKELENRIEELESQMDGMTSVDGAFGDLEGSDLWTGFQSLVEGLGSLAPSIRSLSALTGAVFAFLPVTIGGIMSTTLFAICIIAIIKAIKG